MNLLALLLLLSMYANLSAKLIVGDLEFNQINAAEIKSSFRMLTDTAEVTIPRRFQVEGRLVDDLNSVFSKGDPCQIWLGYNDDLRLEFTGYLDYYEPKPAITLHFQDEMFNLKTTPIRQAFHQVKLADLLAAVAPGYKVQCPEISLGNMEIKDLSPAGVLKKLEEDFSLFSYFKSWETDKVLYSGFAYDNRFNTELLHLQKNVKDARNLNYQVREASDFKVTAISHQKDGSKIKVSLPKDAKGDAETRTLNFGPMTKAELEAMATGELIRFNYSGYRGDLKLFGQPVLHHGDSVTIEDAAYGRKSSNLVDETTTRFGAIYLERTIKLGPQV
ncbi:MAG: hypothetical protein RIE86_09115 [Imperialibacter sp.]|uniref:hypothetical protein n=1 Tax=Imperialibacter sp. TaxID=2038411 RepID=UPI0032F0062C